MKLTLQNAHRYLEDLYGNDFAPGDIEELRVITPHRSLPDDDLTLSFDEDGNCEDWVIARMGDDKHFCTVV